MDVNQFVQLLANQVFAIAVAAYLLIRLDKTLSELRDAIRELLQQMRARSTDALDKQRVS